MASRPGSRPLGSPNAWTWTRSQPSSAPRASLTKRNCAYAPLLAASRRPLATTRTLQASSPPSSKRRWCVMRAGMVWRGFLGEGKAGSALQVPALPCVLVFLRYTKIVRRSLPPPRRPSPYLTLLSSLSYCASSARMRHRPDPQLRQKRQRRRPSARGLLRHSAMPARMWGPHPWRRRCAWPPAPACGASLRHSGCGT